MLGEWVGSGKGGGGGAVLGDKPPHFRLMQLWRHAPSVSPKYSSGTSSGGGCDASVSCFIWNSDMAATSSARGSVMLQVIFKTGALMLASKHMLEVPANSTLHGTTAMAGVSPE